MEKILIIGVNNFGEVFSSCEKDGDDAELLARMKHQFDCEDFFILEAEDIERLEVALDRYYAD